MVHEHGEVGQMRAGAGGVRVVAVQTSAAMRRPLTRHRALRVIPERTVGIEVILQLSKHHTDACEPFTVYKSL